MDIKRTSAPDPDIDDAIRETAKQVAQISDDDAEPVFGFAACQTRPDGQRRVIVGPFTEPYPGSTQTMGEFLKTPGMVAARQLWSLVKPGLPDYVQRPGDMVWLTLTGVSLAQEWADPANHFDNETLLGLTLETAATGLQAVSLLNAAAGRPTDAIGDVVLALTNTQDILAGKDPVWLSLHGEFVRSSAVYKAADGVLKVAEAGFSGDPRLKGVKLNPLRSMISGGPIFHPGIAGAVPTAGGGAMLGLPVSEPLDPEDGP